MQTLTNSLPAPERTFKAWLYELRKVWKLRLERSEAHMYYMGGYSPKKTKEEIEHFLSLKN